MNTNQHELLLKAEVHQIVGCAMEVLNTLGHELLEKPYEKAMVVEFGQMLNYLKITGLKLGLLLNLNTQSWNGNGLYLRGIMNEQLSHHASYYSCIFAFIRGSKTYRASS